MHTGTSKEILFIKKKNIRIDLFIVSVRGDIRINFNLYIYLM